MADVFILDRNRAGLKSIFSHHCSPEDQLPYSEALKCCTALRIYPVLPTQDLLSSLELKRLFYKAADHFTVENPRVELSYLQFERLLKLIGAHCFAGELTTAQRLQLLFAHVQTLCQMHYKVTLLGEQIDTRTTLRKNVSLTGLSPSHRKSLGKGTASLTRVLGKSRTTDSLATERPSKAQALRHKVQQLYHGKDAKSHLKGTFTVKGRKLDLVLENHTPRAPLRQRLGSESNRQLSETLSQYLSFDRKQSESSIKLISPLPTHDSFLARDSSLLGKIRRAVASLETKTDLALKQTKTEGKLKRALRGVMEVFQDCQEKASFSCITRHGPVLRLSIQVRPGAKRNSIDEITPDYIGVHVAAKAQEGAANKELCDYLAEVLGVRKREVGVSNATAKSRRKVVEVETEGISTDMAMSALQRAANER